MAEHWNPDGNGKPTKPPRAQDTPAPATGEVAAAAFAEFVKGATSNQVVMTLKQPPDVIFRLWQQWATGDRALLIPADLRQKIERRLGFPLTPGLEKLVDAVHELRRLVYQCGFCGADVRVRADREWKWLLDGWPVSVWPCPACGDEPGQR